MTELAQPRRHESERHHSSTQHAHNHEHGPACGADTLLGATQGANEHHETHKAQDRTKRRRDKQQPVAHRHFEDRFGANTQNAHNEDAREKARKAFPSENMSAPDRTDTQTVKRSAGALFHNRNGERRRTSHKSPEQHLWKGNLERRNGLFAFSAYIQFGKVE